MSDLNDIFGYKVYRPPREQLPTVPDLNIAGEIVTMIDPSADVIEDATVQALLETMDGERTVKVEDLPPDMRYDTWQSRVEFDDSIIRNRQVNDLKAQEPSINQILLQSSGEQHKPFNLNTARPEVADLVAEQRRQQEELVQQFTRKQQIIHEQQRLYEEQQTAKIQEQQEKMYREQEKKLQEIQHQQQLQYQQQVLLYQIGQIRQEAQNQASLTGSTVATAEQQAKIQMLLLELAKINPPLALQTLKQFKQESVEEKPQPKAAAAAAIPTQQRVSGPQKPAGPAEPNNLRLVHNMGSIVQSEPSEFTAAPPSAVRPTVRK